MAQAPAVDELIGTRVRQHRTALGWTLDELADRSGVSRWVVITVEQGEGNPSIATLLRISDALGVGLPVLVAGAEPPDVVELREFSPATPPSPARSPTATPPRTDAPPPARSALTVFQPHVTGRRS